MRKIINLSALLLSVAAAQTVTTQSIVVSPTSGQVFLNGDQVFKNSVGTANWNGNVLSIIATRPAQDSVLRVEVSLTCPDSTINNGQKLCEFNGIQYTYRDLEAAKAGDKTTAIKRTPLQGQNSIWFNSVGDRNIVGPILALKGAYVVFGK